MVYTGSIPGRQGEVIKRMANCLNDRQTGTGNDDNDKSADRLGYPLQVVIGRTTVELLQ